jgi:hypothetical protein
MRRRKASLPERIKGEPEPKALNRAWGDDAGKDARRQYSTTDDVEEISAATFMM